MNKTCSLLATVMLVLMLGCVGSVRVQALPLPLPENPKFIQRSEPVLGLNQEELVEILGSPNAIIELDCQVPFYADSNRPPIPIIGNTWIYEYEVGAPNSSSLDRLLICVVNRYAVGEERIVSISVGEVLYHRAETLLNSDLAGKAFKGQLDEDSYEERIILPLYTGPEYEI